MRLGFLFLLAVNIVYFFWQMTAQTIPVESQLEYEQLRQISNDIVLAAQAKSKLELAKSELVVNKPVQAEVLVEEVIVPASCFQSAAFKTEAQATAKLASLHIALASLDSSAKVVEVVASLEMFWLIYPEQSSWQESQRQVLEIKAKGVRDVWLIPSGKNRGDVSLGVYTQKALAMRQLQVLQAKGVSAVVKSRPLERSDYHVFIKLTAQADGREADPQAVFERLKLKFKKINC